MKSVMGRRMGHKANNDRRTVGISGSGEPAELSGLQGHGTIMDSGTRAGHKEQKEELGDCRKRGER